jgi:phage terminase small subunit
MARKKSALTEQQTVYVENRLDGKSKNEAALAAGYSQPTVEKSKAVSQALAIARSELSTATQIKRADVIEMLMEAYDMGKIMAESTAMTAAAREIGKMLGFYEAEAIKIELTQGQANMHTRLRMMSDEELLRLASGNATLIEGERIQ